MPKNNPGGISCDQARKSLREALEDFDLINRAPFKPGRENIPEYSSEVQIHIDKCPECKKFEEYIKGKFIKSNQLVIEVRFPDGRYEYVHGTPEEIINKLIRFHRDIRTTEDPENALKDTFLVAFRLPVWEDLPPDKEKIKVLIDKGIFQLIDDTYGVLV